VLIIFEYVIIVVDVFSLSRIHQESHGGTIGEVDGFASYSAAAAGAVCPELRERCDFMNATPTKKSFGFGCVMVFIMYKRTN